MKNIARLVVATTAIVMVSISGMAAPATAAPQNNVQQQRNIWCC